MITGLGFLPTLGTTDDLPTVQHRTDAAHRAQAAGRTGMLVAAAGMVWLTRIGAHSGYVTAVLGPMIGRRRRRPVIAPAFNTGTTGSARPTRGGLGRGSTPGQQLGGSVGTAVLNTIAVSATASFVASHLTPAVNHVADRAGGPAGVRGGARLHDGLL